MSKKGGSLPPTEDYPGNRDSMSMRHPRTEDQTQTETQSAGQWIGFQSEFDPQF